MEVTCQRPKELKAQNNQLKNTQSVSCININEQAPERANSRRLKPECNMVDQNRLSHNTCNDDIRSNSAEKKTYQDQSTYHSNGINTYANWKKLRTSVDRILTVVI